MSSALTAINYNGKILPANTPVLTSQNRAFNYGDGLFETLRVIKGHIPFSIYHYDRLIQGLKVLQIEQPTTFNFDFFQSEILKLCGTRRKARVRFSVFRADGGLYTPQSNRLHFLIARKPLKQDIYKINSEGLSISTFKDILLTYSVLSSLKTINSLPYVLAARQKKIKTVDDVLLFNNSNRVAEASSSNVVIWDGKYFRTPAIKEGCVNGIIRTVLLKNASKYNVIIKESKLDIKALTMAKAVFLTNSVQGVKWVQFFDKKRYDKRVAKRIGRILLEVLNTEVENILK